MVRVKGVWRSGVLILIGSLWSAVATAAENSEVSAEWPSPNGRYVAQIRSGFLEIRSTDPNSKTAPYNQSLPEKPLLNPPWKGFWNQAGTAFAFVSAVGKENGGCQIFGNYITNEIPKGDHPEWAHSTFVGLRQFYPPLGLEIEVFTARIGALHGKLQMTMFGRSGTQSAKWKGTDQIEAQSEAEIHFQEFGKKENVSYLVKWDSVYQVSAEKITLQKLDHLSVFRIKPGTKEREAIELPPPTAADTLRLALAEGRLDQIAALSAVPGALGEDIRLNSALRTAVKTSEVESVQAVLKAGAIPTYAVMVESLMQKEDSIWQSVVEAVPHLKDQEIYDIYRILFNGLREPGLKSGQWLDRLEKTLSHSGPAQLDINARDEATGDTVLMAMIRNEMVNPFVDKLLKTGVNPGLKNKAGETAADIAAKRYQISILKQLDHDGKYAALIREFEIPSDSLFVGKWRKDQTFAIILNGDSTGLLSTLFAGAITWKQKDNKTAWLRIHLINANREVVWEAEASPGETSDTLVIRFLGDEVQKMGMKEMTLQRERTVQ